ncbi:hypothetical protein CBW56_07185 [Denitratisoma oestradiolicum]|nr:hypothetical protein CBW56_07185 [Denitratisoma oestradiolicum]
MPSPAGGRSGAVEVDDEDVSDVECIGICEIDPMTGRCLGCGRLVVEPGRVDDGRIRPPVIDGETSCD